jgi:hypothetical protein
VGALRDGSTTGEATSDGVQRLLNQARWDADPVRDYVVGHLGEEEAQKEVLLRATIALCGGVGPSLLFSPRTGVSRSPESPAPSPKAGVIGLAQLH